MTSPRLRLVDKLAAGLIVTVMVVAALYPETFITGDFSIGSQRITPLTLLLPFVGVMAVVFYSFRRERVQTGIIDLVLLAFMAWLLIRNPLGYTAAVAIKYIVYGAGFYYLVAISTRTPGFLKLVLFTLLSLVCIITVYGFIEFVVQRNFAFEAFIETAVRKPRKGLHRAGSTFAHPVAYGAFLLQIAPFCFLEAFWGTGKRWRFFGVTALVMATLALALTFSKGSILVAVIAAVAAIAFLMLRSGKRALMVALLMLAFSGVIAATFWQQWSSEVSWRTEWSVQAREIGWRASVDTIIEHPLLGVGLRNGTDEINEQIDRYWRDSAPAPLPIDNYFLNVFVEEGAVGFILWMLFLFFMFRDGLRGISRGGILCKPLAIAAIVSAACLCLNAFTFDALLMYGNYVFFWLAAGILRGTSSKRTDTDSGLPDYCLGRTMPVEAL